MGVMTAFTVARILAIVTYKQYTLLWALAVFTDCNRTAAFQSLRLRIANVAPQAGKLLLPLLLLQDIWNSTPRKTDVV
eukprot:1913105-Amphidinium_carterae.1